MSRLHGGFVVALAFTGNVCVCVKCLLSLYVVTSEDV